MTPGDAQEHESALDRRHRVVLWALAISRPQAATPDRIAEALWPGAQPATRDKVIQGSISLLRKTYGAEAIRTLDGSYRLTNTVVTACDHFERQVARARQLLTVGQADRAAFVLADALESWAGPPYQELAHWPPAVAEQGRLAELTLQAEELYVDALLAVGRADDALPEARLLATAEPLRESRWLAWAKAAYRAGNQADALQVLRDCRETLSDELGIDPSDELGALEIAILRQDPALTPEPRPASSQTCPWPGLHAYEQTDADGFFGRDSDTAHGLRVFGETGVLAVAGPSGIGKSSFVRAGLANALVRSGLAVHVTTPQLGLPDHLVDVLVLDQAEELFALPPTRPSSCWSGSTESGWCCRSGPTGWPRRPGSRRWRDSWKAASFCSVGSAPRGCATRWSGRPCRTGSSSNRGSSTCCCATSKASPQRCRCSPMRSSRPGAAEKVGP